LQYADIKPINRAFAPMVREGRFDVSEMAIATFLQAIAYDCPLVLLPVVMAARFQEQALICRADSDLRGPGDLVGRRVGVRAYSQTTGMWLRGTLQEQFGVEPARMRWVTFEGAHVPDYVDPPWAERAAEGSDLLTMLRCGEIDAAIVGNELPDDPGLRTVFADPVVAGDLFLARYGFVPVNHLVVVRRSLAEERPELVVELMRMFRAAGASPVGRLAVQRAVEVAERFCWGQGLLPRRLGVEAIWAGLPGDAVFD
jgi:4,5-dihydroxyphthalate decarboxylase